MENGKWQNYFEDLLKFSEYTESNIKITCREKVCGRFWETNTWNLRSLSFVC